MVRVRVRMSGLRRGIQGPTSGSPRFSQMAGEAKDCASAYAHHGASSEAAQPRVGFYLSETPAVQHYRVYWTGL